MVLAMVVHSQNSRREALVEERRQQAFLAEKAERAADRQLAADRYDAEQDRLKRAEEREQERYDARVERQSKLDDAAARRLYVAEQREADRLAQAACKQWEGRWNHVLRICEEQDDSDGPPGSDYRYRFDRNWCQGMNGLWIGSPRGCHFRDTTPSNDPGPACVGIGGTWDAGRKLCTLHSMREVPGSTAPPPGARGGSIAGFT